MNPRVAFSADVHCGVRDNFVAGLCVCREGRGGAPQARSASGALTKLRSCQRRCGTVSDRSQLSPPTCALPPATAAAVRHGTPQGSPAAASCAASHLQRPPSCHAEEAEARLSGGGTIVSVRHAAARVPHGAVTARWHQVLPGMPPWHADAGKGCARKRRGSGGGALVSMRASS